MLSSFPNSDSILSPPELSRAESFRYDVDRQSFTAAHIALRLAVAVRTGFRVGAVEIIQRCAECGGEHGKPQLATPSLHLSLSMSHVRELVFVAVGSDGVGVDLERVDAGIVSEELLHTAEVPANCSPLAFFKTWTQKEALFKALGGFSDPTSVDPRSAHGLHVLTFRAGHRHVASLAASPGQTIYLHLP